jgi:hypothetical protein
MVKFTLGLSLLLLGEASIGVQAVPRFRSHTKSALQRLLMEQEEQQQADVQEYELWEPSEISETLARWADHYPDLVRLTTAQEA